MYSEITNRIRTFEEAQHLISELEMLLEKLYQEDERIFNDALNREIRAWVSSYLKKILFQEDVEKEKVLKELIEKVRNLNSVKITIAFEPTESNLDRIHSWVLTNIGKNYILDIGINPYMVAGATVVHKGKYKDYSLRKQLTRIISSKNQTINEILSK